MKSRLIVAAVGVPLTLVVLLFAPMWLFDTLVGAVALFCAAELLRAGWRHWWVWPIALLTAAALCTLMLYPIIAAGAGTLALIPFGCAYACDAAAMLIGAKFGKRHIFPKISPNKTLAGAVGGVIGSVAFMAVLVSVFCWTTQSDWAVFLAFVPLLGIPLGLAAEAGDLLFSLIKRKIGVKDYGNLLGGHGGVLDRFDSMVLVAPASVLLLLSVLSALVGEW